MSPGRLRVAVQNPLARRFGGYGAGSLVAAACGELGFIVTYGWAQAGTTWATAVGFVCAAVPNYILNRKWAWSDRRGRSRRAEIALYLLVVAVTFAASALVTHWVAALAVFRLAQPGLADGAGGRLVPRRVGRVLRPQVRTVRNGGLRPGPDPHLRCCRAAGLEAHQLVSTTRPNRYP